MLPLTMSLHDTLGHNRVTGGQIIAEVAALSTSRGEWARASRRATIA